MLEAFAATVRADFRDCEYFLGTSAGSIVAATLAAGRRPEAGDRAAQEWARRRRCRTGSSRRRSTSDWLGAVGAARRPRGGDAARPAGDGRDVAAPGDWRARPSCAASPRPERTLGDLGSHIEALGARFDGRLRIAAVDRASGRRVIFGAPDAPRATVAQAVLASCAVPWMFAPVEIGEREYVDGGVWSPTNLDAVPAGRGSRMLCLIPTAGATLASLRTASAAAAGYESMALRARGATIQTIVPDQPSLDAIGANLMDPSRRAAVAAAGYAQGRRLTASG